MSDNVVKFRVPPKKPEPPKPKPPPGPMPNWLPFAILFAVALAIYAFNHTGLMG